MTEIETRRTAVEIEEQTPAGSREMAAARAEVRVTNLLAKAWNLSTMTQKQLAECLGVTEGRVSQVLNSNGNLRITTIARYLRAMGYRLTIDAEPVEADAPSLRSERTPRRDVGLPGGGRGGNDR